VAALDLVGLALVHEPEAQAALVQPAHGRPRVANQDPGHPLVAAPERDPPHVGEELVLRVRVEVGPRGEVVVDALEDVAQLREAAVRDADRAGGEGGVAARPLAIRLLEHEPARAPLARRVSGRHARVAGADDDDVVPLPVHGAAS
jgi:hypothetical protein